MSSPSCKFYIKFISNFIPFEIFEYEGRRIIQELYYVTCRLTNNLNCTKIGYTKSWDSFEIYSGNTICKLYHNSVNIFDDNVSNANLNCYKCDILYQISKYKVFLIRLNKDYIHIYI